MQLGFIANPASGKDIRRLVAYATVIDNNEKVNIVKRALLAAQAAGVERMHIMPDTFRIGYNVKETLQIEKKLSADFDVLEMAMTGSAADTTAAAQLFEKGGAKCVIVLGGDGTSRAAAKALKNTPLLPVSTGTNNVYPDMTEGTIAGLAAAAAICLGRECCLKDKRIELYKEGKLVDIALVDAVISSDTFTGARAIWNTDNIKLVIAARAHPASIGFSAFIGSFQCISAADDFAMATWPADDGAKVLIPISAGVMEWVKVHEPQRIEMGGEFIYKAEERSMIALDGEREVSIREGESIVFRITRDGPWRVDVRRALELAQQKKLFFK